MRTPSIKTLSNVFQDPKQAKKILLMARRELTKTGAGAIRLMNCVHPTKTEDLRLSVLNSIDNNMFGVECIISTKGEYADYLNTGDTYALTLIYWNKSYRVQSVGDFIETMERQGVIFK
jgi:hypothetical protein